MNEVTVERIQLSAIEVPPRLRAVSEPHVEMMAGSMEERGLDTPITVRPSTGGQPYTLVIGAHRFTAAERLGWTHISAIIRTFADLEARLAEVDENLIRHELNAKDRMFFLREAKQLREQTHPEIRNGGDRRTSSRKTRTESPYPVRFTLEMAEKMGLAERQIQEDIAVANALDPEAVALLEGMPIVRTRREWVALSKKTPEKQRAYAREINEGRAKNVHTAMVAVGDQQTAVDNPQARHLATLLETWVKADAATRAAFLQDIGATLGKTAR